MSTFTVNGKSQNFNGDPETPLLWYLRDIVGMTGTKFGCGGRCAAPAPSISTARPCAPARSRSATSTARPSSPSKGCRPDGMHPVQKAWRDLNVAQCGYCQIGQIMQAASLLKDTPKPTDRRSSTRHERQHLSLRHLSAHPRRHQARRAGRLTMTTTPELSEPQPPRGSSSDSPPDPSSSPALSSPATAQEKKYGGDGMPGRDQGRSAPHPLDRQ